MTGLLVAAVLLAKFDWRFAAVTFGAVVIYIVFTVVVTEWRMEIRRRANELDSRASTGTIYWEGAVRALRRDAEVGTGYLELTGYWKPMKL